MFRRKEKKKLNHIDERNINKFNDYRLSHKLESNIKIFDEIFCDDDTLIKRSVENQINSKIRGCILFFEGMADKEVINENIIQPFVQNSLLKSEDNLLDRIKFQVMIAHNIEKTTDMNKIINSIYNGDSIFLLEGFSEALIILTKGWETRSIEEPETERVLRGPREGFTESLLINLSLIKRKLRTPDLKIKSRIIGERSHTKICVCYIKGIANPKVLEELNRRLDAIKIDGVMDSGYIQEFIRDFPYTPFKTVGSTERPDIIAGKLLEGRIAIVVDGTPVVVTVPHIFIEYFQSNDDYYINYYFSSIGRVIRILGFTLTISVPAIYVALTTYHQELIPTPLILNIAAAREGVPLPTIFEVFSMLLVFEILRETGLRMPMFMGQALSIVGVLVIGQAAVDARFVSAPMVIVVAFTGITGLMITRLNGPVIVVRGIFLLLAGVLGLYGYIFGVAGLLIHLFQMRTFGIPYMYKLMFLNPKEDIKDTIIRAPWWYMKYRPKLIAVDRVRNKTNRGNKS